MRREITPIEPRLATFWRRHCSLMALFSKSNVVCTRAGGTAMCCCTQAESYDAVRSAVRLEKREHQ